MKHHWTDKEYKIAAIAAIWPWPVIILIAIIAIIKGIVGDGIDPMDNSINKSREVIKHLEVVDTTRNGFRVVYVTKYEVTKARFEEISNRKQLNSSFKLLQKEARIHFNDDLLNTDIYDFTDFALKYNTEPDVVLHNIFVTGFKKCKLYLQPNDKIPDCATLYNPGTEQGILYINYRDIYSTRNDSISPNNIYRYWKCSGLYEMSSTDEQFSHFSEKERIR